MKCSSSVSSSLFFQSGLAFASNKTKPACGFHLGVFCSFPLSLVFLLPLRMQDSLFRPQKLHGIMSALRNARNLSFHVLHPENAAVHPSRSMPVPVMLLSLGVLMHLALLSLLAVPCRDPC